MHATRICSSFVIGAGLVRSDCTSHDDGASRARTGDLLGAIQALSQLSYSPEGTDSVAALRRRSGAGRLAVQLVEPPVADRGRHVLRLVAVPRPVVELDRRVLVHAGL